MYYVSNKVKKENNVEQKSQRNEEGKLEQLNIQERKEREREGVREREREI